MTFPCAHCEDEAAKRVLEVRSTEAVVRVRLCYPCFWYFSMGQVARDRQLLSWDRQVQGAMR